MSDNQLIAQVKALAYQERSAAAALVAHLAILDERRLYLGEGFSSLFAYCTHVLHLSEHATYNRIEAARAARRFPVILDRLGAGDIHLTSVRLLAPHLTEENRLVVLDEARHLKTRDVEEIVARLQPRPSVLSTIRRLPATAAAALDRGPQQENGAVGGDAAPAEGAVPAVGGERDPSVRPSPPGLALATFSSLVSSSNPLPPSRRAVVEPLAPGQFRVQFTADEETRDKLRLAQDLLRHRIPDGDLGKVINVALTAFLNELAKQKHAATDRPRVAANARRGIRAGSAVWGEGSAGPARSANPANPSPRSRYIPAAVRRAVWARDGGQCAFVAANGRRCPERGFLEFHHVEPYAAGGAATVDNIQLRCRSHNG